jgi:hypothetical protein
MRRNRKVVQEEIYGPCRHNERALGLQDSKDSRAQSAMERAKCSITQECRPLPKIGERQERLF